MVFAYLSRTKWYKYDYWIICMTDLGLLIQAIKLCPGEKAFSDEAFSQANRNEPMKGKPMKRRSERAHVYVCTRAWVWGGEMDVEGRIYKDTPSFQRLTLDIRKTMLLFEQVRKK